MGCNCCIKPKKNKHAIPFDCGANLEGFARLQRTEHYSLYFYPFHRMDIKPLKYSFYIHKTQRRHLSVYSSEQHLLSSQPLGLQMANVLQQLREQGVFCSVALLYRANAFNNRVHVNQVHSKAAEKLTHLVAERAGCWRFQSSTPPSVSGVSRVGCRSRSHEVIDFGREKRHKVKKNLL